MDTYEALQEEPIVRVLLEVYERLQSSDAIEAMRMGTSASDKAVTGAWSNTHMPPTNTSTKRPPKISLAVSAADAILFER